MKLLKNLKKSLFSNLRILRIRFLGGLGFLFLVLASASFAAVNYDTAWTFVYDGGKWGTGTSQTAIDDKFHDVKALADGSVVSVGETRDTAGSQKVFLMKLNSSGRMLWKKFYDFFGGGGILLLLLRMEIL